MSGPSVLAASSFAVGVIALVIVAARLHRRSQSEPPAERPNDFLFVMAAIWMLNAAVAAYQARWGPAAFFAVIAGLAIILALRARRRATTA